MCVETLWTLCVSSLLAEDSEEEGDQCRICQIAGGSLTNPLLEPCGCGGSLRFVHQECLKTWLKAKIKSGRSLIAAKEGRRAHTVSNSFQRVHLSLVPNGLYTLCRESLSADVNNILETLFDCLIHVPEKVKIDRNVSLLRVLNVHLA